MGVVPRAQSKLLRALHAHRGEKHLQDLQTLKSTAMKRAMVRFRGTRKTGAIAFVECLGVPQEDTMQGPLWRETLGRSLESHDAAERVGGMCHSNGFRQETLVSTQYLAQRRDGAFSHNRVFHQALARSLRESKVQFVVEDAWSCHESLENTGTTGKITGTKRGHTLLIAEATLPEPRMA